MQPWGKPTAILGGLYGYHKPRFFSAKERGLIFFGNTPLYSGIEEVARS